MRIWHGFYQLFFETFVNVWIPENAVACYDQDGFDCVDAARDVENLGPERLTESSSSGRSELSILLNMVSWSVVCGLFLVVTGFHFHDAPDLVGDCLPVPRSMFRIGIGKGRNARSGIERNDFVLVGSGFLMYTEARKGFRRI